MNPSGENNMVTIINVETAKRIQYMLHRLPYYEVSDVLDELTYAIAHKIEYNKLVDTE